MSFNYGHFMYFLPTIDSRSSAIKVGQTNVRFINKQPPAQESMLSVFSWVVAFNVTPRDFLPRIFTLHSWRDYLHSSARKQ